MLAEGRVTGIWRLDRRAGRLAVEPFTPLSPATRDALAGEVADIGSFFDQKITLTVAEPR